MKAPILSILFLAVSALIPGCEEPDLADTRQARLVGNQNLELKKQLKLCDQEIQRQKDLLAKCKEEKEKEISEHQKSGQVILQTLQNLAHTDSQVEELTEENELLETRIQELEAKLANFP